MPEGDSIFRAARGLQRALAGQTVTRFESVYAHLSRVDVDTPLAGRTILRCESAGKHLLIVFSGDLILRTHMRMNGSWHLYRHGEKWWRGPDAMRIRIDTADWVAVAFHVPVAEFVTERVLERRGPVAELGPDLLAAAKAEHGGAEFDRAEAIRRLITCGSRPIAESLLDQRIVAGIGNVYKSEVLFVAGVHPSTPTAALTESELGGILEIAASLLHANVSEASAARITTVRGLRQSLGRLSDEDRLNVYGRAGQPCRRCGTPIRTAKTGPEVRSTYWCPTCQGERGSTVGGR